jgi:prepilin-type processing-associated H-X9-DG protein
MKPQLSHEGEAAMTLFEVGVVILLGWLPPRHGSYGYLGFADGSAQGATTHALRYFLGQAGVSTNRLAIP